MKKMSDALIGASLKKHLLHLGVAEVFVEEHPETGHAHVSAIGLKEGVESSTLTTREVEIIIRTWKVCSAETALNADLSKCDSIEVVVNGASGTGKTVAISAIVKLFEANYNVSGSSQCAKQETLTLVRKAAPSKEQVADFWATASEKADLKPVRTAGRFG